MNIPVGIIAAAIALPLVFGILRRLFPAVGGEPGVESLEGLKAIHHRTEVIGILVFFVIFIPCCGYAWWLGLVSLAETKATGFGERVLTVSPHGFYWALAAILPAGITAAFPTDCLIRFLEHARYRQWLRYLELKYGYRQNARAAGILHAFLAVPAILLVLLKLNWYFVVTEDDIQMNPWFSAERVYGYDAVAEIEMNVKKYENSDYVRRTFVFEFRDGFAWTTTPGLLVGRQDKWAEIAQVIARRSGVAIVESGFAE